MMLGVSKPLFALLLVVGVASVISALKPELPGAKGAADLLPPPRSTSTQADTVASSQFVQERRRLHSPPALQNHGYAPPPPPPPIITAPVVAKPTAPNLPFVYFGRMVRDGQDVIFLKQGENVEAVTLGGKIEDTWRLERIDDDKLVFRYLPLDETRQLLTSR